MRSILLGFRKEECEKLIEITDKTGYSEALVNIGFGLDFLDIKNKKKNKEWKNSKFLKPFSTFYFAVEIFNLFNFKNVISRR